jgi:hypothetical protein
MLKAMRAHYLRWLADEDPTLTHLKHALALERAIQALDTRALCAFVRDLEARYIQGV